MCRCSPLCSTRTYREPFWDWTQHAKDNDLAGDMHFGVMAQEVEQIDPDLVVEMSNGYKAVKYHELLRTVQ